MFERASPRHLIMDLRRDHQFVGRRFGEQRLDAAFHGVGCADDRVAQRMVEVGPLVRQSIERLDRARQQAGGAPAAG